METHWHEPSFEALVNQYQTTLLRMCYVYLHDQEQAKDAVQETFLKAYKAIPKFNGNCSEKTWLMRIAINTCRDFRRSAWFRYTDRRIAPENLPAPTTKPTYHHVALTLAVMQLKPKLKEVILLHYYQNMTVNEMTHILGTKQSTISMRLKKAKEELHQRLKGESQYEPTAESISSFL